MTSKLTRERIELIANFHRAMALPPSHAEIEELARMALAAMDSEPVIIVGDDGGDALSYRRLIQSFEPGTKLYRHAQPAPVVPAVSDDIGEIRVGRLPTMNQDDYPGLGDWWVQLRIGEDSDEVLARVYGATPQEANNRAEALACRAAMLQAEPVTTANKLGIPDGSEDTKRLNWLDAQNKRLNEYYGTSYGWKFDANFQRNAMMLNDSNYPVMTVRQAIDEAIAAAPQEVK
ncbi:hypothetical protein [Klebsiella pneumoniae]|uniref:hypothetical protein n=1 Tax=Klebsiella pneumoniae TaxID=573 RepID=UPI001F4D8762|nr:hypothetical protein [Klebsiella pneumoniae]MCH9349003.1 hypothetical protein [Klebsiella pneumoniae]MCH9439189.1 hypothetical protein [Klebsiella pneumoniae]MCH9468321.1 hypothetical protein [Klebsiella pneumoniae]MCH9471183.1 hypothetical protein [Klebsiella pneumoniae]MCH9476960.1 hypothetical protein [Klebsiella pneumoniae]